MSEFKQGTVTAPTNVGETVSRVNGRELIALRFRNGGEACTLVTFRGELLTPQTVREAFDWYTDPWSGAERIAWIVANYGEPIAAGVA